MLLVLFPSSSPPGRIPGAPAEEVEVDEAGGRRSMVISRSHWVKASTAGGLVWSNVSETFPASCGPVEQLNSWTSQTHCQELTQEHLGVEMFSLGGGLGGRAAFRSSSIDKNVTGASL